MAAGQRGTGLSGCRIVGLYDPCRLRLPISRDTLRGSGAPPDGEYNGKLLFSGVTKKSVGTGVLDCPFQKTQFPQRENDYFCCGQSRTPVPTTLTVTLVNNNLQQYFPSGDTQPMRMKSRDRWPRALPTKQRYNSPI